LILCVAAASLRCRLDAACALKSTGVDRQSDAPKQAKVGRRGNVGYRGRLALGVLASEEKAFSDADLDMADDLLAAILEVVDAVGFHPFDAGVEEEWRTVDDQWGHIVAEHRGYRLLQVGRRLFKQRAKPIALWRPFGVQLLYQRWRKQVVPEGSTVGRKAKEPIGVDAELNGKECQRSQVGHPRLVRIDPACDGLQGAACDLTEVVHLVVLRYIPQSHFSDQTVGHARNKVKINLLRLCSGEGGVVLGCHHFLLKSWQDNRKNQF